MAYKAIGLKGNDEVILPALCWPTSLWPLYQAGLKIKFVDIDLDTLNYDLDLPFADSASVYLTGNNLLLITDFKFEGDLKDELLTRFGHMRFVCYSTASSKTDAPKFRLVFPIRDCVPNSKIRKFWFALQSELGELGDKQTKDLSRMYYIPAEYDSAFNFIFSNSGTVLDPDFLIQKYPMPEKANLNSFFDFKLCEALVSTIDFKPY